MNNENNVNNSTKVKKKLIYNKTQLIDIFSIMYFIIAVIFQVYKTQLMNASDSLTALYYIILIAFEPIVFVYLGMDFEQYGHKSTLLCILDGILTYILLIVYPGLISYYLFIMIPVLYFILGLIYICIPFIHCYFDKVKVNTAIILKFFTKALMVLAVAKFLATFIR